MAGETSGADRSWSPFLAKRRLLRHSSTIWQGGPPENRSRKDTTIYWQADYLENRASGKGSASQSALARPQSLAAMMIAFPPPTAQVHHHARPTENENSPQRKVR